MRIALVQMQVSDGQPLENLSHAEALIRAQPDAELYLLPEVWTTGYDRDSWSDYVTHHHTKLIQRIQALATELQAWIGGSCIAPHESGGLANRFILCSPKATEPIHYDKVHLFAPLGEDQRLIAGDKTVHTTIDSWQAHLSICYDLRFPAMYRASALDGTELFLIVSQWPKKRCHHMVAMAKSRAIENQAYVVLCNRIGVSKSGLEFGGQSGIWDPDGKQLADAGTVEAVVCGVLDQAYLQRIRKEMPLLK